MDKGAPPSLFVNDGSFMERFKQLQQEQEKDKDAKLKEPKPIKIVSGSLTSNLTIKKNPVNSKANDSQKTAQASSNGKLAFSLKQKSKLVPPPVVLSAEEDEEETNAGDTSSDVPSKRQKLNNDACTEQSSRRLEVGNYYLDKLSMSSWLAISGFS